MAEDPDVARNIGFGPYDSLRSLTEAGVDGMRDATRVFGGFVSMLESGLAGTGPTTGAAPTSETNGTNGATTTTTDGDLPFGDARAMIARLGDLYINVVLKTMESSFDAFAARSRLEAPRLQGQRGEAVTMTGTPGGAGTGELFIHNHDQTPTSAMTLLITDLTSSSGAVVDGASIELVPPVIERVEAGATARVQLSTRPPLAAGVYFGHILVREAPTESVPVRLIVENGAEATADDPG